MPIYDYRCRSCREPFQVEQSMRDVSIPSCERCQSLDVVRIWSASVISVGSKGKTSSQAQESSSSQMSSGSCCGSVCGSCD